MQNQVQTKTTEVTNTEFSGAEASEDLISPNPATKLSSSKQIRNIGTRKIIAETGLVAAEASEDFFLTYLVPTTTPDEIINHLKNFEIYPIHVKKINSNLEAASFRIRITTSSCNSLLDTTIWPEGTSCSFFENRRRRKPSTKVRGSRKPEDSTILAASLPIQLVIGECASHVTPEIIKTYLADIGHSKEIAVSPLTSEMDGNYFKIVAPSDLKDDLFNATAWPTGVKFGWYRPKTHPKEGPL